MHVSAIDEKRGYDFEREQREVCEKFWRGREKGKIMWLYYNLKNKYRAGLHTEVQTLVVAGKGRSLKPTGWPAMPSGWAPGLAQKVCFKNNRWTGWRAGSVHKINCSVGMRAWVWIPQTQVKSQVCLCMPVSPTLASTLDNFIFP